jgi:hypothetical protein
MNPGLEDKEVMNPKKTDGARLEEELDSLYGPGGNEEEEEEEDDDDEGEDDDEEDEE